MILSYLTNRQQRVKINDSRSDWVCIKIGVPQGSLLGPVLFNIFINDLALLLQCSCEVYNYADDNTLSYIHANPDVVKITFEKSCAMSIKWFSQNHMKANPDKFQFMLMGRNKCHNFTLDIAGVSIQAVNSIKLLGVSIDNRLDFGLHIDGIIVRCSKQIGALCRLSHVLDVNCKMKIVKAFITANFTYCCVVYNECKRSDAQKLEKLLKRALRCTFLDFKSPYDELLQRANMSPLYIDRQRVMLHTVHKILYDNCPPVSSSLFERQSHDYGLRNRDKLVQPYFNTHTYGYRSLKYQGARFWNMLPDTCKHEDFNAFKQAVSCWSQSCNCGHCLLCNV